MRMLKIKGWRRSNQMTQGSREEPRAVVQVVGGRRRCIFIKTAQVEYILSRAGEGTVPQT